MTAPTTQEDQETAVRHGYTLTELHRLTVIAVAGGQKNVAAEWQYEQAWDGIVDELLAAEQPPPGHLVQAGRFAVRNAINVDRGVHGVARGSTERGTAPRFVEYWTAQRITPSPEALIVDRLALIQVWPMLLPYQRNGLAALAATDDYQAAADLLGITPAGCRTYISQGRRAILALLFEHEAPPRRLQQDHRRGARRRHGTNRVFPRDARGRIVSEAVGR